MQIRCGYEITYECPAPTPMILMLSVHPVRLNDLVTQPVMTFTPQIEARDYCHGG